MMGKQLALALDELGEMLFQHRCCASVQFLPRGVRASGCAKDRRAEGGDVRRLPIGRSGDPRARLVEPASVMKTVSLRVRY